eukprot:gene61988-biopygen36927
MGGGGADVLDGGSGIDTADYTDKTVSVAVSLAGATPVDVRVNGVIEDTIVNIEYVFSGSGNDTLIGDSLANRFEAGAGDDFLRGGGGADFLDGAAGIDTADYSDKTAAVSATLAGAGVSTVTVGGVAEDTIRRVENLIGGSGADTLTGDALANRFMGGVGNDVLDGGVGSDTADYSEKAASVVVTLAGGTPVTVTVNGVAEDTISNIENISGGIGKDTLIGDAFSNRLEGGFNNDVLMGGGGADVLDGGVGIDTADYSDKTVAVAVTLAGATPVGVKVDGVVEDTISNIEYVFSGSGNDTLVGDGLFNRFEAGAGDDLLRGGGGADFLDGGAGIDTADYSDKSVAVSATLAGAGVS